MTPAQMEGLLVSKYEYHFLYIAGIEHMGRSATMSGGTSPKVFAVEDSADLGESARLVLRDEGYRVTTASNGAEALEAVGWTLPKLILLDMKIPGRGGVTARAPRPTHPGRRSSAIAARTLSASGSPGASSRKRVKSAAAPSRSAVLDRATPRVFQAW